MAYKSICPKLLRRRVLANQERTTSATNFICFFRRSTRHWTNLIPTRKRLKFRNRRSFQVWFIGWWNWTLRDWSGSKGRSLPQRQFLTKRIREKPILVDEEIQWRFNQIRLETELFTQAWKYFRKFLRNFINFFAFNYKDLRDVILETQNIKLSQNKKAIKQKSYCMILNTSKYWK